MSKDKTASAPKSAEKPKASTNGAKPDAAAPTNGEAKEAKPPRSNEHLKWKPRTLSSLRHLALVNPGKIADACAVVIEAVSKLADDYAPYDQPTVALAVGDIVRCPDHEALFKRMGVENRVRVIECGRGWAKVDCGGLPLKVESKNLDILARKQ